ncbi:hypothetical protein ACJX0J_020496 [Zea mays]
MLWGNMFFEAIKKLSQLSRETTTNACIILLFIVIIHMITPFDLLCLCISTRALAKQKRSIQLHKRPLETEIPHENRRTTLIASPIMKEPQFLNYNPLGMKPLTFFIGVGKLPIAELY